MESCGTRGDGLLKSTTTQDLGQRHPFKGTTKQFVAVMLWLYPGMVDRRGGASFGLR